MKNTNKYNKIRNRIKKYYFKRKFCKIIKNFFILKKIEKVIYDEKIYDYLSFSYLSLGKLDNALFYVNIGLEKSPGFLELMKTKSYILEEMGSKKEYLKLTKKIEEIEDSIKNYGKLDLDKFYKNLL